MSEKAYKIYTKVASSFDKILFDNLSKEDDETRDYVEQRILDEYRPWDYMSRGFKHDKEEK